MHRRRKVKSLPSESSDEDEPLSKLNTNKPKEKKLKPSNDDSSSESDIESYLQPINKIDLDSPFFNMQKTQPASFDKVESEILSGVNRLTDSESEDEKASTDLVQPAPTKLNFSQLHEYTRKLEEAKRTVDAYNARKQAQNTETDIQNLLASVELKSGENNDEKYNSSDFESCSDSEKEGWEEVGEKQKEEKETPRKNLEITVEMPGMVKKQKKQIDLMATIKRRINRIRKENQVLVHKVHLLCWIAHGNYVNSKINSDNVLGVALSLIPSQQCYPADRTDLTYLEQILKWFRNAVENIEKPVSEDKSLNQLLEAQIAKKQAYNKRMLVYIFVAILRALGIQCRLVLSFQVEPLRPPNSELHSLSTKNNDKDKASTSGVSSANTSSSSNENASEKPQVKKSKARTKSTSKIKSKDDSEVKSQTRSKSTSGLASTSDKIASDRAKSANEEGKKSKASTRLRSTSDSKKTNVKSTDREQFETLQKPRTSTRSKSVSQDLKSENLKPKSDDVEKSKASEKPKATPKSKNTSVDKIKPKSDNSEKPLQKPRTSTRSKSTTEDFRSDKEKPKASTRSKRKEVPKSDEEKEVLKHELKNFTVKIRLQDSKNAEAALKSRDNSESKANEKRQTRNHKELVIPQVDGANDTDTSKPNLKKLKQKEAPCPVRNHPKRLKTVTKYKDSDSDSDDHFVSKTPLSNKNSPKPVAANLKKLKNHVSKMADVRDDIINLVKKNIKEQKDLIRSKTVKKRKSGYESDGSDYIPQVIKKKRDSDDDFKEKIKVKRRVQVKTDPEEQVKKKKGVDVWVEVFLETEEKWISVDVVKGQVHCVSELYARASHPVSYIVAWNNDNTIKDITRRYCPNFNTVTRKLRTDSKWWQASVKPFMGVQTTRDKEEDDELDRQNLAKPLPTSIAEYKNHPLYVLKRHLLKFEALYPPDPPPLGFVRNEPVYSRQCVYILHSRDIWLKHAKVVKPGEKPYKIVKARPKWDKLSNSVITDQLLEVFGPWQTQDYEPPTAENGVVPRNAFGNVELFKPCMLPKKTVHLQLPGLNKVAKRMNIDCAPALVGFDFHGGWNHPTYDGFIVCEEFADVLVAAWELEQEEIEKKEQEKIDKRVYGNWKRLIRGLLIRERLKVKYEFGEPSGGGKGKKKAKGGPKLATKKRKVESESESD